MRRERYEREQSAVADGSATFGRNQGALQMSAQLTLAFARAGGRLYSARIPTPLAKDAYREFPTMTASKGPSGVGFSPLETIRMATLGGATFLGIQNRTGSIAVGKEADLQVVRVLPITTLATLTTLKWCLRTESHTTRSCFSLVSRVW